MIETKKQYLPKQRSKIKKTILKKKFKPKISSN
jgi:hypothetical protein